MSKWFGPIFLGAFGVLILCALGVWQLQRLEWKEGLIAQMESQMASAPVPLESVDWLDGQNHNAQPITLKGRFGDAYFDILSGHEALGAGYRRVQSFVLDDGRQVMVELGFLSESQKDQDIELPQEKVEIEGHIFAPESASGSYDATRNIWVGYDVDQMAQQLGTEPIIIAAKKAPVNGLADTPMTIDLPNNHLQYAITWFLLALAWAGMALYWGIKRNKEGS